MAIPVDCRLDIRPFASARKTSASFLEACRDHSAFVSDWFYAQPLDLWLLQSGCERQLLVPRQVAPRSAAIAQLLCCSLVCRQGHALPTALERIPAPAERGRSKYVTGL